MGGFFYLTISVTVVYYMVLLILSKVEPFSLILNAHAAFEQEGDYCGKDEHK